jgi:hypothetical protein
MDILSGHLMPEGINHKVLMVHRGGPLVTTHAQKNKDPRVGSQQNKDALYFESYTLAELHAETHSEPPDMLMLALPSTNNNTAVVELAPAPVVTSAPAAVVTPAPAAVVTPAPAPPPALAPVVTSGPAVAPAPASASASGHAVAPAPASAPVVAVTKQNAASIFQVDIQHLLKFQLSDVSKSQTLDDLFNYHIQYLADRSMDEVPKYYSTIRDLKEKVNLGVAAMIVIYDNSTDGYETASGVVDNNEDVTNWVVKTFSRFNQLIRDNQNVSDKYEFETIYDNPSEVVQFITKYKNSGV